MLSLRAGMPMLRCRTLPSAERSTGRNAHAPLSDFTVGRAVDGQECPCSVLRAPFSPQLRGPKEFYFSFRSFPFRLLMQNGCDPRIGPLKLLPPQSPPVRVPKRTEGD